jgi:hypothetical protein
VDKEKDAAEQEVQSLQHKKSSDDMDLPDHRREPTRCVSRGRLLDVSDYLLSKLTVWKEDQFTVLSEQGIK